MGKCSTYTSCLTLPLQVEPWQADVLNKRMEIYRNIYNSFIGFKLKELEQLKRTRVYRDIIAEIDSYRPVDADGKKKGWEKGKKKPERVVELYKELNALYKEWHFTEFGFIGDVARFREHYKDNTDSTTVSATVAKPAWVAFEDLLFGSGRKVSFKKKDDVNTISNCANTSGLVYRDGYVVWKKHYKDYLKIKVKFDKDNAYEEEMLSHRVKYCRIVRKWIKNKYQFYVQIVLECQPAIKVDSETGEIKHPLGKGRVGLFIGPKMLIYSCATGVGSIELADKIEDIEAEKRRLLRHIDRSRRATNPDNFNEDGTIRRGVKLHWVKSKEYERAAGELRELYRKQADIRKMQHNILANQLLALGDEFYIIKTDYKKLQQRASYPEDAEKTPTGKYKSKKRFGKSIGDHAPAMFISILNNKLKQYGQQGAFMVNLEHEKGKQYSHIADDYVDVNPNSKYIILEEQKVRKDFYSAFLVMNADKTLKGVDKALCDNTYDKFLELASNG